MVGFPNTPSEWVKKARLGDQEALGDIYDLLWAPGVTNAYYRMGHENKQEAEDLVSEKLVKVLQKLSAGEIEGDDNFSGYFYRALTNALNDYFDENRHKKPIAQLSSFDNEEYKESFKDQISNGEALFTSEDLTKYQPEENMDKSYLRDGLYECLWNLPERQRSSLCMHYFDGKSIKEISELLHAKENTVKSWIRYGKQNMEQQIRKLQKEKKGFLTVLPIPFLVWALEETEKEFVAAKTSKFASEIVLVDESLKNKQEGKMDEKQLNNDNKEIKLKQAKAHTRQIPQVPTKNQKTPTSEPYIPPVPQTVSGMADTATKSILSYTITKVVVGIVFVGIVAFGGMKLYASMNSSETVESTEKNAEATKTKYKSGLYSFIEDLIVYDSTSMDSANGYTVHVNDLGAGGNRIYLSKIIEKDNVYYGKIEGGYVCVDDGTQHLSYESEKPIMMSDYFGHTEDFANACDNPDLLNAGYGGTRPEGWYFNYTPICDGTLIYY